MKIRTRNELIDAMKQGYQPDYVFFWGHTQTESIDKTCFSQWYPSPFTVEGIEYPTAEHYMMAAKARLFNDQEILEKIIAAPGPKQAKTLGRKVKNFDDKTWKENCSRLVTEGNIAKFSQHKEMGSFLISTGSKVLVEASPVDRIWGIGLGQDNPKARDPMQWNGDNLLGFALMEVREQLLQQQ